jgi:tetratricopeptide (TPR) repeat protein
MTGSARPPYAWVSLGDTERGLEAWAVFKPLGGIAIQFVELGDYFFLRDYQGLNIAAASAAIEAGDILFLLPSLYYLRKWDDAISMLESWSADHRWPVFLEIITGTGDAPDWQYSPVAVGRAVTQTAYYGHALASVGRRQDAESVWRRALELGKRPPKETPRRTQEQHHLRLLVFASRGEKEAALSALEAMVDAGWRWLMSPGNMDNHIYSVGLGWFEDSPLLDSIRDEPRFIAAVEKVKADNAAMLAELNAGPIARSIGKAYHDARRGDHASDIFRPTAAA